MPEQPFGPQQLPAQVPPKVQLPPQAMGGMASLTPQEGQPAQEGGSFYEVSPEVMNMMWQPQPEWLPPQTRLTPQQQLELPPEELY